MTVTTAGGTSGPQGFTINLPPPTLTSVSPNQGIRGTTVAVTLTGTNFVAGATTVNVSGAGVTVTNVVVGSPTSLTASFVLDLAAAAGPRTVTVTTAGGTSGAQTFTINLPPPGSTTFTYTGGEQTFTVPAGVVSDHDSAPQARRAAKGLGRPAARVAWAVGPRRPCPSRRARCSRCVSVAAVPMAEAVVGRWLQRRRREHRRRRRRRWCVERA